MADLSLTLGGIALPCPVLPASGTFGLQHARVFDIDRLGALVPKTITPGARTGHPAPRLAEAAGGILNAIGIPSDGVEAFIRDVLPLYKAHRPPVIVSVSADTAAEFADMAARFSGTDADGLELNLSCPNLEAGGRIFAADPRDAEAVVAGCRAVTTKPLWCKLTPAATAPGAVAAACEAAGADALIAGNTMPAMVLDKNGAPRVSNRTGGLSGPPLKPVGLRIVDDMAGRVAIPVIGCGGVMTLSDVRDYFAAGASAVAVGTGTLARPSTMVRLIDGLAAEIDARGTTLAAFREALRVAATGR
ncbi:dihydroorotate dehydrogenase [Acuticoccus sp. MNP-M23]|uniref:dihydroorotate dehydrogenase n=1 Tax=Acuticoccus sp. MNP-M23 TaxID=3072793 RepID=UPI0028152B49|nr:dihydroorotate dehydrogenase [Acuticoccus sp. MNP-M23]WMS43284.1 dihydroorotate dehydrogenase [Acuticoccus sp. MNP-M23]